MSSPAPLGRVALLVVGGGPAALAAARSFREHGGAGPVLLVSDDDVLPYLRPPLSKDYLRGETPESEIGLEPAEFYTEHDVTVRLDRMVTGLNAAERRAQLAGGEQFSFDHCVLATGNSAASLPVPGGDDPRVRSLRSLDSARRLRSAAAAARTAVVVGSGFVGCEAAVSLARLGLSVTLCSDEERPQERRLGGGAGRRIADWLCAEGVTLRGGAEVTRVEDGRIVHLHGGGSVAADLVLVAVGTEPRAALAVAAGLEIEQGRVAVDERMRSSVPAVLAAGDVACARNAGAGRRLVVEHWGEAEAMGRVAGATAAGGAARWSDPPGFWTVIGDRVLKYTAWGDGFDVDEFVEHDDGGFTVWYWSAEVLVGVATHDADDDYERGTELVRAGASRSAVIRGASHG